MTYDQLTAFVAVVSAGSFAGASKLLHKSQPAVSKLVQNLEHELGIRLFDRSAYRPTLTQAGQLFHERASALLEETLALRSFADTLTGQLESHVTLVLEAVTPLPGVLRALGEVQRRYPKVRFELRTERMGGALEALDDGRAELAITGSHGLRGLRARTTEVAHYGTVRIVPVAARNHALAHLRGSLSKRVLRTHTQVVLRESGRGELEHSVNVLEGGLRWCVTDIEAKKEILLAGMGWGGLPEHVVKNELLDGRLVALKIPSFNIQHIELSILRSRDRGIGPVARALWEELLGGPVATLPARARGRSR
ncbi:MAG: LysR family transcriptional regulator [Myxococcales bacterium]